jgi:hypothetical protein
MYVYRGWLIKFLLPIPSPHIYIHTHTHTHTCWIRSHSRSIAVLILAKMKAWYRANEPPLMTHSGGVAKRALMKGPGLRTPWQSALIAKQLCEESKRNRGRGGRRGKKGGKLVTIFSGTFFYTYV